MIKVVAVSQISQQETVAGNRNCISSLYLAPISSYPVGALVYAGGGYEWKIYAQRELLPKLLLGLLFLLVLFGQAVR
jgi:hypothetical protein